MSRFRVIVYAFAIVMLANASRAFAQAPILFFTDIESGPKTGGENNKGVYVTLYGQNFGSSQGSSTVTVGGGAVDHCPVWGSPWLWYQKIACQLGPKVNSGDIVVTVNGTASNALPFAVRGGKIYFVDSANGRDSNDGSFGHPWKTIICAKNTIANGDTVYLRSGTWKDVDGVDGGSGLVMDSHTAINGMPKAMLGYPGETATIAPYRGGAETIGIRNIGGNSGWWTFGEIEIAGSPGFHYGIDWEATGGGVANPNGDGLRFVGMKIHGSRGSAAAFQGNMSGNYFLGNDVYGYYSIANGASSERGYGIYYGGYGIQQNLLIDHNLFWNDQGKAGMATKGLQIYGHCPHDCGGIYDYFKNVTVSNNQFLDNCMMGAAIGGTDGGTNPWDNSGTMLFYNNLVAGNGSCDTINDLTYSGLQIGDGYGGMHARVLNNTFYLNAGGTIGHQGSGDIDLYKAPTMTLEVTNNIFYAQPSGQQYTTFIYEEPNGGNPSLTGTNNLFFSNGNPNAKAPSWVTHTVSTSDPLFINPTLSPSTADFHLKPTSPARKAGTSIPAVASDITGAVRPQNAPYHLGAYQSDPTIR